MRREGERGRATGGARRRGPLGVVVPTLVGSGLLVGLLACQEHEFEPPSREARVERAEAVYSPALFDTLAWESDSVRVLQGNLVFSAQCRDCHGPLGEGGTPYAREQGLEVPSLVASDWAYAGDIEAVRRRIFVGHPEGMPSWGIARVSPREIDAAAHYVLEGLRGEGEGP